MLALSLEQIVSALNGKILNGGKTKVIKRVITKVTNVKKNTLYFDLEKKKDLEKYPFDETNVIVTEADVNLNEQQFQAAIVIVQDIYTAYWDFVSYYRRLFDIPVIGITGTCGKTTTTEMVKTILSKYYKTRSSYDGNNIWYLSLPYLMAIDHRTEAAVYEMGVSAPGHLRYICNHLKPQVGVLMNIGTYHLLGCKTFENYVKAKAELLEGLEYKGTLILNRDDQNIKKINLAPFEGNIVYFGFDDQAHFRARNFKYGRKGISFELIYKGQSYRVWVPDYGRHTVYNALAAIAAAYSVGINISDAISALASYKPVRQHMQIRSGVNGCTIIDDTWNCTPPSMESGLEVLQSLGKDKKKVAVLGHMPQIGAAGQEEYGRIGKEVAHGRIDCLITVGNEAKKIGWSAVAFGFAQDQVFHCSSAAELYETLLALTDKKTLVLFKFPYKYRLSKIPSFRDFMNKVIVENPIE